MTRVLAAILVLSLAPGLAEVVEDVSHWMVEGHTLHAPAVVASHDGHASHDDHEKKHGDDEHGCSTLFHLCGCHSPTPSVTSMPLVFSRVAQLHHQFVTLAPDEARRPVDGVVGETFRPPIA